MVLGIPISRNPQINLLHSVSLWLTPMGRIAEHPKSLSGLGQHSWNVLMWTTVCQSLLRYGRDSSLGTWRNDLIGPGVVSPGLPSGEYSCLLHSWYFALPGDSEDWNNQIWKNKRVFSKMTANNKMKPQPCLKDISWACVELITPKTRWCFGMVDFYFVDISTSGTSENIYRWFNLVFVFHICRILWTAILGVATLGYKML